MQYINIDSNIPWDFINSLAIVDDICIKLPLEYNIIIKKNINFKSNLCNTLSYLKKYAKTNWFLFFYDADYSNVTTINTDNINTKLNINYDIMLVKKHNVINHLNFIKSRYSSAPAKDNIYDKIFSNQVTISLENYKYLSLADAGSKAKKYLDTHVVGKFTLDSSSTRIAGGAFSFTDGLPTNKSYGYGRGWHFSDVYNISLLEATERFVSQYYAYNPKQVTLFSSFNNIKDRAYPPSEYLLEKDSKFSLSTPTFWTLSTSLISGEKIWVPEDLAVYGNHIYRSKKRLIHDSSNGVSLGGTYAEAMIGSILELIERHSFLLTWFGNIPRFKLDWRIHVKDKKLYNILKTMSANYDINIFEISFVEPIYVIWCLIINKKNNSKMYSYSAASADFNLDNAISGALLEAIVGMTVYENNQNEEPKQPLKITTLEDHVKFYGNSKCSKAFNFTNSFLPYKRKNKANIFCKSDIPLTQGKLLQSLIKIISQQFKDILCVNLTSDDLKNCGLYATKVIIPGIFPMTFGDNSLRIDTSVVNKYRSFYSLPTLTQFNNIPHPFP